MALAIRTSCWNWTGKDWRRGLERVRRSLFILFRSSLIPEITGMRITQSVEAPLTLNDRLILGGSLAADNGRGSGNLSVAWRRIINARMWSEVCFGVWIWIGYVRRRLLGGDQLSGQSIVRIESGANIFGSNVSTDLFE